MTDLLVWAPIPQRVCLWIDGHVVPMVKDADSWWSADGLIVAGSSYGFLLDDDETVLPDPASRWQPDGVHAPSRRYDQSRFEWTDTDWTGRTLPGAVIYELHVGTFTAAGTFDGVIEHLPHLADLGVTHLELMPVNAFDGDWGWGYDGVGWYAVQEPYGGPDGLKRLVDAAHGHGLAVVLDVVYNHLGPSGNYLPRFGPYFNPGTTSWGDVINLDGKDSYEVRRFIIANALMWLTDYHLDALRLDAVHALQDTSTPHLLDELTREVDALSARLGRPLSLIAESDLNDPSMVNPLEAGGHGLTGQWNDDVHHAIHALITGERQAYYDDFGSLAALAKVLTSGFLHDGTYSTFRNHNHGRPIDRHLLPGYRFIVALQNHDQVGNRERGRRLTELTTPALLRVAAVVLLTSPFTPMLWMGEEWAASTRWPYFTAHTEPALVDIGKYREQEFAAYGWDPTQMIDPQDPHAFADSVLDWNELAEPGHTQIRELYRNLIALRRTETDLADPRLDQITIDFDEDNRWLVVHRG
ncbi:MAG TPA: malto-oligosyltrehalose trehalohydrolase, partial [Mycobacterium sp.]|nr:malto-oligosyltrehalose trehalohydrolase [Mycobacterium sp.]